MANLSMADFEDRVRNVLRSYLDSVESQGSLEYGEQRSVEMDGRWAGEEKIAPGLGSNVTQNPGVYPLIQGETIVQTAKEPRSQAQASNGKNTQPKRNYRKHQLNQISGARQYAIIEVARKLKLDTLRGYREEVERRFELHAKNSGKNRPTEYARITESSVARLCIKQLGSSEKLVAEQEIDYLIGVILNEPNWQRRVDSPTWAASRDVETRLLRTPALDDWHNRMIYRLRQRLLEGSGNSEVEKAEEDQTLDAVLEADDRARPLFNVPEGKGILPMPEEADSLERLIQDPNYGL